MTCRRAIRNPISGWWRSSEAEAAVDRERDAGDVGGRVGGEEGDRLGNVCGCAEALEWNALAHEPLAGLGIVHHTQHGSVDDAGADGVDADAVRCELDGELPGESDDAGLAGVVGGGR